MDIRRCYDLFLTDRKVSGCSESTLRYLTSTDSDSSVDDLQTHILPFFQHLQQQNLSPSTYHTLFRGIRPFTRILHQEEYVEKEIRLPKVKQPYTTIFPLTPAQMRKVLHSFNSNTYWALRKCTIAQLFPDRVWVMDFVSCPTKSLVYLCLKKMREMIENFMQRRLDEKL